MKTLSASSRRLKTPKELKQLIQKSVIGQDAVIGSVATAIYFQQLMRNVQRRYPEKTRASGVRNNLLLAGPSGCGKTLIAQTAAESAGVPFVVFDATQLSQTGYIGAKPEDIVVQALAAAGGDPVLAESSVVVLDEVDKLARKESGFRDVAGEGVQQGLLKLIEGRVVNVPAKSAAQVFTGNMLWVVCGAFEGIEQMIETRLRDEARGSRPAFLDDLPDDDLDLDGRARRRALWQHLSTADLVRFGIIPELCGRLNAISCVEELGSEALLQVLRDSEQSILKERTLEFAIHGIELQFTPDALSAVCERAMANGGGARGLTRELTHVLNPWRFQVPDLRQRGINRLVVTRATVTQAAEPYLKEGPPLATGAGFEDLLELPERAPDPRSQVSSISPRGHEPAAVDLIPEELKQRLGWWTTTEDAQSSFREVLRRNPCSSEALLTHLNEMLACQPPITFAELRAARVGGDTTNLEAMLAFAVYVRSWHRDNPR